MKTLKFFAVVIAAFAMLVACEPQETPTTDDNKPGTNDTTAVDTVPTLPPTQELEKVAIDLVWGSATEINGKVFEVGMANYDELFYEMIVHVTLSNPTDEAKIFTMKEVRSYDLEKAMASVCISNCTPGNQKAEQDWQIGTVAAGSKVQVDLHLMPVTEEATVFPAEFTFSDGKEEVKFTLNYNYTPIAE